ncbi:YlcI/YnfO family protein [Bacillus mycoides]|jgi:predicted HicB family RNase H-like nuclease|uniref:YlcI/YnfO family protein n=1 Tax=Bacillus mycoides TaxID=1405 RepID=UPI0036EA48CE
MQPINEKAVHEKLESVIKAVRIDKELLERANEAKEKYEVPISLNRFIVHAVEQEVERKGV